ncbi:exonuclease SbcCD subunit D [Bacillus sp. AFS029533]|uniref:exonuclease SbcCD subunit D n=1 Tax=Bacillus sp. AFS029533 TaxID=2033494 RepID=UPI000BFBC621|nr:exonuclease SbcCD subunit D [Bacillus sp. AFS029533]PGZ85062.1 exonuclease sbcCD subunit D [Bacillus sp. AFS029533]
MKFIHTADWHLGKIVHGVHMTEDQRFILDEFISIIKEEKPDAVVIAGDLYDKSISPTEAIELLNEVFHKIVIECNTPILAISGNHDSAERIEFGSRFMEKEGLYLVGKFQTPFKKVILNDDEGEVHFYLIPYAEPSIVRYILQNDDIHSHDDAMKAIINKIRDEVLDSSVRNVFVGHAFVTNNGEPSDEETEGERTLSIGGAEYVSHHNFKHFNYTALGHLHRAHFVGNQSIRYSGSPLKYSISEENHKKGCLIVDLKANGELSVVKKDFHPKRDLRSIEGTIEEIRQHSVNDDYVFVKLTDEHMVVHPMEQIRTVYPNAMHVSRKRTTLQTDKTNQLSLVEKQSKNQLELFQSFYKEMKNEDLKIEDEQYMKEIIQEIFVREE